MFIFKLQSETKMHYITWRYLSSVNVFDICHGQMRPHTYTSTDIKHLILSTLSLKPNNIMTTIITLYACSISMHLYSHAELSSTNLIKRKWYKQQSLCQEFSQEMTKNSSSASLKLYDIRVCPIYIDAIIPGKIYLLLKIKYRKRKSNRKINTENTAHSLQLLAISLNDER